MDTIGTVFGRTELRIGPSKAKFDARLDFQVHLAVALQKPDKKCEELNFGIQKFAHQKNMLLENEMLGIV